MILSMLRISRGSLIRVGVVLVALIAWLGIGGVGGAAQGKLSQVQENDARSFLPESAESTRVAELNDGFEQDPSLPALVVLATGTGEDATTIAPSAIAAVTTWASGIPALALPGAEPGGPQTVGDLLVSDPVAFPSEDGKAILVPLALDSAASDELIGEESAVSIVVQALRDDLSSTLGSTATSAGDLGLRAWVTGPAGYVADLVTAFGGIDGVLLGVALLAVLVILVLVYRSPFLPFVVILVAVFALSAAGLVVYQLAKAGTLTLNGQSQGILSILVVGAGVDYALLIIARYREELHHVADPFVAIRRALRAAIEPVSASAGTVIAGVLCLTLSDLRSNQGLGPVAAIGIAAAYLANLTLLPAILVMFGRRSRALFWPRRPAFDPAAAGAEHVGTGVWGRWASTVGARPRTVAAVSGAVLLGLAAFLPTLRAGGTDQADIFLTDVDAVSGSVVLAEHFPAGSVQPAVVIVPADEADAAVAAASAVDGVVSAAVYTGAEAGPQSAGGDPVVVDGRVRVDVVTSASPDTQEGITTVADLRSTLHAEVPGALVGGAAAEQLDVERATTHDLRLIVPVVLAVIFVILALLLRSVVAAGLLIVVNVLSFAATLGLGAIVFNHVLHWPPADRSVPLYAFVFLVALGVDYSIFLMTRVREEAGRFGTRRGVLRGLAVTGGVITSAGIVLASTFAALGIIPLLFLAQLAFLVSVGVLIDTLVVRSLLVPAVVHRMGEATWWPSKPARAVAAVEAQPGARE